MRCGAGRTRAASRVRMSCGPRTVLRRGHRPERRGRGFRQVARLEQVVLELAVPEDVAHALPPGGCRRDSNALDSRPGGRMAAPAQITGMEWEESLLPPTPVPPALEAEIRRLFGVVPGWLPPVAPGPWLARSWASMLRKPVAHVSPDLCDLVALVVSQDNSCRYCFGAQRAVLRMRGYREAYIARLERDFHVAELSDAERAALDFARRKIGRASCRERV